MTFPHKMLRDLKPNWNSYGAPVIDEQCIQKAFELWRQLHGEWQVMPCSDGGVQLEQHREGFDIEITVSRTAGWDANGAPVEKSGPFLAQQIELAKAGIADTPAYALGLPDETGAGRPWQGISEAKFVETIATPKPRDLQSLCDRLAEMFNTDDTPDELSNEAREAIEELWQERDRLRSAAEMVKVAVALHKPKCKCEACYWSDRDAVSEPGATE